MNRTVAFCSRFAGALAVLAAMPAGPVARAQGNADALRAGFNRADLNTDGFLDGEELAKAFRGQAAKVPPPIYDDTAKPTAVLTQAQRKYPDLVFLWAADTDGDQRVSWPEYQNFSRKHGAPFGPGGAINLQAVQAAFPQGFGNQSFARRQVAPYVYAPNRQFMRGHRVRATGGIGLGYARPGPGAYQPYAYYGMTPLQRLNAIFAAELRALGNPDPMSNATRMRYPWLYNQTIYLRWLGRPASVRARMPRPMARFAMPHGTAVVQGSMNNYWRSQQAAARGYQRSLQANARAYQRAMQGALRNRQRALQAYMHNYQQMLRANTAMRQRQVNYLRSHWRRR